MDVHVDTGKQIPIAMQKYLPTMLMLVVLLGRSANALLLARPCTVPGNPWLRVHSTERSARIIAMISDNVGHSPFNSFPSMQVFGNCVNVYFEVYNRQVNITVQCKAPFHQLNQRYQCPRYDPNVRWLLVNLFYIVYDEQRFELSSCVTLNATHSYHGSLLLADDSEPPSNVTSANGQLLPMWQSKLTQPDMVPFTYTGDCDACSFRNEYIGDIPIPDVQMNELDSEPYCVNGTQKSKTAQNRPVGGRTMLYVVMLSLAPVFLVGGLVLCKMKTTSVNTVAPAQESDKA